MVWSKLIQRLDFAMSMMSLFSLSNEIKFIRYTLFPLERIVQELIDYPYWKPKPKGRVEVVQDGNNESNMGDDVYQLGELVDPYWVAPSIDLEENSNFHVVGNTFIDVDAKELNGGFSSNEHAQVNEDDYRD
jgi:hypothetical protein